MSTQPPVIHKSFTLEREYPVPPAQVFKAFSDPAKRRRWFAEGEGFIIDSYQLDFKVGGLETSRFRFGEKGPPMTLDSVYLDIVPNARMVYAYAMTIDRAPLSSSLGTIELVPTGKGTLLRLTEHTAFVDGKDGSVSRREGTQVMLGRLAKELEAFP